MQVQTDDPSTTHSVKSTLSGADGRPAIREALDEAEQIRDDTARGVCAIVGAGPGLGRAAAFRFARGGYRIALIARSAAVLAATSDTIEATGGSVANYIVDVADAEAVRYAFTAIRADLGDPDVLIYNAAAAVPGGVLEVDVDALRRDLGTNVLGALACFRAVIPAMRVQRRGTVLVTGGGITLRLPGGALSLAVGKSALRALTLSVADELKDDGIRVVLATLANRVAAGGPLDPVDVAERYWELHRGPAPQLAEVVLS